MIDIAMLFVLSSLSSGPDRNATVLRIWGPSIHRAKKTLATAAFSDDIVAVRHDLPHMPSLGVSSLDSRPPWQHGGLLFLPVSAAFAIDAPPSFVLRCSIDAISVAPIRPSRSFGRQPALLRGAAKFQRQRPCRRQQVSLHGAPPLRSDNPALIQVERPGDLDLYRVSAVGGRGA